MSRFKKLIEKVLQGNTDKNIGFEGLRNILIRLGFQERINGSHHIFTRNGIEDIINLQPNKEGNAKPYQVKQAREIIVRYKLIKELEGEKDNE